MLHRVPVGLYFSLQVFEMLTHFPNSFTDIHSSEFVVKRLVVIPTHLNYSDARCQTFRNVEINAL